MQCNIDSKGKAVRLVAGIIMLATGIIAISFAVFGTTTVKWLAFVGLGMCASGLFAIFEGWAGWCVLRAMGVKTRV